MATRTRPPQTSQAIASTLKRLGVRHLFGIPGGGSSIDLIEACEGEGIPFVLVQHETSAAIMGVVSGELSGSCGACISIMGPGATNLAAGASYAYLERHPLLCITECYGPESAPLTSMQNIDHAGLFAPLSKGSVTIDRTNAGRQIEDAVRLAMAERPGPVHIDLPHDPAEDGDGRLPTADTGPSRRSGDLEAIAEAIDRADKPLLIVGPVVGRGGAGSHVLSIAEKLGMAVMVTSKARGIVPEDHPLYAGVMSGVYKPGTFEERIVGRSDLVVAVGLDRVELLSPWRYTQPLIAIDEIAVPDDETVGRPILETSGPLGDLLESLETGLRPRTIWDAADLRRFWDDAMDTLGAGSADLNATSLLVRARALAPKDTIVATEAGVYGRVGLYAWKVFKPSTLLDSSGANTMGFSVPAAIAAALTRPSQKAVGLVGDGGFLMRVSELETAARLGLSPVFIVFDDATLGMIRIKQQSKGYERVGVDLSQTDFVRLAESFGGRGREVRTMDEFDAAFRTALSSDRLEVIDARLDPDVYASHIPPIRG